MHQKLHFRMTKTTEMSFSKYFCILIHIGPMPINAEIFNFFDRDLDFQLIF